MCGRRGSAAWLQPKFKKPRPYKPSQMLANPDVLILSYPQVILLSSSPHLSSDYSIGVLNTICSPFFPCGRIWVHISLTKRSLSKMSSSILLNNRLRGHVDLVLRPRRCGNLLHAVVTWHLQYGPCCKGCNAQVTTFGHSIHSVLNLFDRDQVFSPSVEMMTPTWVCFLKAYISRPGRISARSTWENTQLFSVTSKFVYIVRGAATAQRR